jgi:hypothetical protein
MNKIVASIGMAALGASSLHTVSAQELGVAPNKLWNVSATLRGFYDDNVNTAPDGADKNESFGIEVAPGVGLNLRNDATTVGLGYRYSGKYYESISTWDHTHTARLSLDHSFNERYRLGLSDSFVVGQEPDLRPDGMGLDQFQRLSGNNIRNYASIFFSAQLTPLFGTEVGYNNSFFEYDNEGISTVLDRVEHTVYVEGQFQVRPNTQLLGGYQYGMTDYTAEDLFYDSDDRNTRSHYFYGGVTHQFRPDFSGSVRAGIQYVDYYNTDADGEISPYVQAVLNYMYATESNLRVGVTHRRSPIYVADALDADTTVLFATVRHRITPSLFAGATGTFQNSIYNGGPSDGDSDQLLQLGLNLEYLFTANLSAEVGYNFDHLTSDSINSDFDRNRVYIGLTARY